MDAERRLGRVASAKEKERREKERERVGGLIPSQRLRARFEEQHLNNSHRSSKHKREIG